MNIDGHNIPTAPSPYTRITESAGGEDVLRDVWSKRREDTEQKREREREREMYGQSKAVAMPWALGERERKKEREEIEVTTLPQRHT